MNEATPEEPTSAMEALIFTAKYLDITDRLFVRVVERFDPSRKDLITNAHSTEVQEDLRSLAAWFDAHPEQAQEAWDYVKEHRT